VVSPVSSSGLGPGGWVVEVEATGGEEEPVLVARAQSVRGGYCDRLRARIVLAAATCAVFEARYNTIARPFSWNFTHNDLEDLLYRIDALDNRQPHALAA
jgi:hypothetical protein